ncbi:MAG TPA: DUF2341 domain-containing protein, partial [Tepidisphaeraceae bacterium]|nr:DUF2341 domain-containing protein [Tepidisphaeraceae bacterium]
MMMRWLWNLGMLVVLVLPSTGRSQDSQWRHSGSMFILTTLDAANLPASASVKDFPLLVRLNSDFFNFSQAQAHGEDLRFVTSSGKQLPYQIDQWDAETGRAAIWVRVPEVKGDSGQELRILWGNPEAKSESSGPAVFNETNGYVTVLHMDQNVVDDAGALKPKDTGTTPVAGIIGAARHFAPGHGIFCGDHLTTLPTDANPHTSQAWIRAERSNGTVLAWGNEHAQGKVVMQFRSPPHINMDCYFSGGNVEGRATLPLRQWVHVVHTYQKGDSRLYVNGVLDGTSARATPPLNIKSPARFFVGGWYDNYTFAGDIDEVRLSNVVRPADWVKLEYENQKPLQTLVGPIVQPGDAFSVSPAQLTLPEGGSATFTAQAGGARKIAWVLKRDGVDTVVCVDRLSYTFDAGRVSGDTSVILEFKAIFATGTRTIDVPVTIREQIPDPVFTLQAPAQWNGRDTIEVVPVITNPDAMKAKGAANLGTTWTLFGGAVIKRIADDGLILDRSQFTGTLHVAASISNGGTPTTATADIQISQPASDAWVRRSPDANEQPVQGQFYARDASDQGTLFYNGKLDRPAESVFLRLYADDQLATTETHPLGADRAYAFAVKLKPGLIKYKVEFG